MMVYQKLETIHLNIFTQERFTNWRTNHEKEKYFISIFCEKPELLGGDFDTLRVVIATITALALAMIVLSAALAWRQWGFGTGDPPHDAPSRDDRLRFQGYATLLLSALSFIAVIFTGMPVLFLAECLR